MPITQLTLPAWRPPRWIGANSSRYWTKPLPISIRLHGPACRWAASIGVRAGVHAVPALSRPVKREPAIMCPACGSAGASCWWTGAGVGGSACARAVDGHASVATVTPSRDTDCTGSSVHASTRGIDRRACARTPAAAEGSDAKRSDSLREERRAKDARQAQGGAVCDIGHRDASRPGRSTHRGDAFGSRCVGSDMRGAVPKHA